MATDSSNPVIYLLRLPKMSKNDLRAIWHWPNLQVAIEGDYLWIKGLTSKDIQTVAIQSLLDKSLFLVEEDLLYPVTSTLPTGKSPVLNWKTMEQAIPLTLPNGNYHFFGITQQFDICLLPSNQPQDAVAILVSHHQLAPYIQTAPAVRLEQLKWIIVGQQLSFIMGTPILPIPGFTYWQQGNALLPTGYRMEYPFLHKVLDQELNPDGTHWVLWNKEAQYSLIPKVSLRPLSIASFRQSIS